MSIIKHNTINSSGLHIVYKFNFYYLHKGRENESNAMKRWTLAGYTLN